MNNHIVDKLRPTDISAVVGDWEQRQSEIWHTVAAGMKNPRPGRTPGPRRRITTLRLVAVAAVVTVLALIVPAFLPHGSSQAAAELEILAASARKAEPLVIKPGQYLYVDLVEKHAGPLLKKEVRGEKWTAHGGSTLLRSTVKGEEPSFEGPNPHSKADDPYEAMLQEMPREPEALEAWLRPRVKGSTNQDEAVFVALTDMLRDYNPDPELRAVMIKTLARISHVTVKVDQRDSLGRPASVISRKEPARGGAVDHHYFDPRTGIYLEQWSKGNNQDYHGIRVAEKIVDSRPR